MLRWVERLLDSHLMMTQPIAHIDHSAPSLSRLLHRLAGGLLLLSLDAYALGSAAFIAVWAVLWDGPWPVLFVANFIPWLLLPAVFLLIALLLTRRRFHAALMSIPVFLLVAMYGAQFLPGPPQQACSTEVDNCRTITFMTYNVAAGAAPIEKLHPVLSESGADVIALEELGRGQARFIDQALADQYPYRILHGDGYAGMGLLSRYPIIERDEPFYVSGPVPYLRAVLYVRGRFVTVVIGHPPRPTIDGRSYRPHPAAWSDTTVLTELATAGSPAVMLGDFNMTDRAPHYQIPAQAGLHDAFREAGWGFGFTYPVYYGPVGYMPTLVRIDYVWHTDHFTALDAWVGEDGGSDHLPVLATLRLNNTEAIP